MAEEEGERERIIREKRESEERGREEAKRLTERAQKEAEEGKDTKR